MPACTAPRSSCCSVAPRRVVKRCLRCAASRRAACCCASASCGGKKPRVRVLARLRGSWQLQPQPHRLLQRRICALPKSLLGSVRGSKAGTQGSDAAAAAHCQHLKAGQARLTQRARAFDAARTRSPCLCCTQPTQVKAATCAGPLGATQQGAPRGRLLLAVGFMCRGRSCGPRLSAAARRRARALAALRQHLSSAIGQRFVRPAHSARAASGVRTGGACPCAWRSRFAGGAATRLRGWPAANFPSPELSRFLASLLTHAAAPLPCRACRAGPRGGHGGCRGRRWRRGRRRPRARHAAQRCIAGAHMRLGDRAPRLLLTRGSRCTNQTATFPSPTSRAS